MKVLIIHSDSAFLRNLTKVLRDKYLIDVVYTGIDGCSMASFAPYDLIMLGLVLPDLDGVEVCRNIRKSNSQTPILVISSCTEISSKVSCFDYGADDYLTKPFSTEELLARVRALLRRTPGTVVHKQISASGLTIDLDERRVYWEGMELYLRRKEFELLECLVRNKGFVVPREKILLHVWNEECDRTFNCIDVHICRIRRKINALKLGVGNSLSKSSGVIKTVRGLGYKIGP